MPDVLQDTHTAVGSAWAEVSAALSASPAVQREEFDAAPMIDLDANATTRPLPEVVGEVMRVMQGEYRNPSSAHWLGASSRALMERARDQVSALVPGILPEGVVFTSGGTEGNNAVIASAMASGHQIITSRVEHASILAAIQQSGSARPVMLEVDRNGVIDPDEARRAAREARGSLLVSIQWANSETGVVQPVADIVDAVRRERPDAYVHTDVAQALGRVALDVTRVPVDVLTFSGHKLHAPQGTGAILFRDPDERRMTALLRGGGQERGRRSGTPNVPGCAGLGVATWHRATSFTDTVERLAAMRDLFEVSVLDRLPQARVNGATTPRVPNTTSIMFPGVEAMLLLARLDAAGLACSTGSACSAARPEPSHVLTAMGLSETEAFASLRFSFSIFNTLPEVARAADLVVQSVGDAS